METERNMKIASRARPRHSQSRAPLQCQVEALDYALDRNHLALFMEMRLGKSLVAIRWAQSRKHSSKHILVVAPLTVLPSWERELGLEWVPPNQIHMITKTPKIEGDEGVIEDFAQPGWYLTNYERVRAFPPLLHLAWDVLILDESTRIRNPKAQTTKLFLNHTDHIPRKAILSGMPAPESPMDYFCQLSFLNGHFMGYHNYWGFRQRYFASDQMGWDWSPRTGTIQKIKDELKLRAFTMTRKEAKVGSRKVYEQRHVQMEASQKRVYKRAENEFVLELTDGDQYTNWNVVKFTWMQRIAGGYAADEFGDIFSERKTEELWNLLTGELRDEKVVVWFRFNREMHEFCRKYQNQIANIGHVACIEGETPFDERKKRLRMFNQGTCRVLFAQVKCAKFGVDCSAASTAIYFSNGYDYEDRIQSEDRIIHPTKHEPVLYIDLITKDTVDEEVVDALRTKHANARIFMTRLLDKLKERRNG